MKISLDMRFAHLAGGGRVYVQKLVPTLVRKYPTVQWRFYYNRWCEHQQRLIRRLQPGGIERLADDIELRPVRSPCLSLRHHLEFFRYHDDSDLYHYLHFDMPVGMRGIRLVVTIHDLYPLVVAGYCSAAKRRYFHYIVRHNVRRAAAVIAISEYTKKDIIEWCDIPAAKITVIPQSHDSAYRPIDDAELLEKVRRKYALPDRFVFYTGNHKPHKNLSRLISGYARLPVAMRREFPLVLTGRVGQSARKLLNHAGRQGVERQLRFVGWVDQVDLPVLYNLASLVVLPSLYEGFGCAPLEAMACGRPVVCSNATAIPEVVGPAGRLFDPYNVAEITAALAEAIEHDLDNAEVRAAGLQQAEQFSVDRTAQLTFQLYSDVVGRVGK